MSIITPDQSRQARRELGLSQADVASAIGINRAYLSDFESGNLIRLTNAQLKKLRSHYEEKIAEAIDVGDQIDITFGDVQAKAGSIKAEPVTTEKIVLNGAPEVPKETIASVMETVAANDKELLSLFKTEVTYEGAFIGNGELSEGVLEALRQVFSLLATNYLLLRSVSGWPELGLSATSMNIANDSVLGLVLKEVEQRFAKAGIIVFPDDKQDDSEKEAV